jgi:superfamily I DNA/RNA helicase
MHETTHGGMQSATHGRAKRPAYTDAQRQAVVCDGHTLLEAGAGSGKTTTLVGKILHALGAEVVEGARVERPCELSEIAAITFTTAAAADLRKALRARFREYAARHPERRWRQLVYEVDRARIGTIHSFCGQLLREFALREGLDPAFGVLDAGEAADLREECARVRLYAALGRGDADASELAFQFTPHGAVRLVRDAMDRGEAARQAAARWCDADGRARIDALQAHVEQLGGTWRPHDAQGGALAAAVLRLAGEARAAFDEALDARGALDYDALITRTRDLLARSPDVLAAARRRLAWLFIDEFQDTDPAQRDIAYALCGIRDALDARDAADGPRASMAALPGRCPSLCVVGDPKQSIYGFRRADVTLWNAVARDFTALGAAVIPLDTNFRSRAPILGLVNATVGALMPAVDDAGAPDYEVRYRPLAPARDHAGDDRLVELLEVPEADTAPARRQEEARRIAARVRAMVEGRKPSCGTARATASRCATATSRSSSAARATCASTRPSSGASGCRASSRLATGSSPRARCGTSACSSPRSPTRTTTWRGSACCARRGSGSPTTRSSAPYRAPGRAVLRDARRRAPGRGRRGARLRPRWLAELRQLRDRVPCAALVERALERSGTPPRSSTSRAATSRSRTCASSCAWPTGRPEASVAAFVAYLRERGESSAREGEAALHTAGEDVVTLTTVHGAKGLEWPVVFLCDLDREMMGAAAHPPSSSTRPTGSGSSSRTRRGRGGAALRSVRVPARPRGAPRRGRREARVVRGEYARPRPARPVRAAPGGARRRPRRIHRAGRGEEGKADAGALAAGRARRGRGDVHVRGRRPALVRHRGVGGRGVRCN